MAVEILLTSLSIDRENEAGLNNGEEILLKKSINKLEVDKTNQKCMDMTPLHLAVWNDYNEIAIHLIQSNADPYLKMNGTSNAFDLAIENKNQVLFELLNEYYANK